MGNHQYLHEILGAGISTFPAKAASLHQKLPEAQCWQKPTLEQETGIASIMFMHLTCAEKEYKTGRKTHATGNRQKQ